MLENPEPVKMTYVYTVPWFKLCLPRYLPRT